jgi:hypothetical protein
MKEEVKTHEWTGGGVIYRADPTDPPGCVWVHDAPFDWSDSEPLLKEILRLSSELRTLTDRVERVREMLNRPYTTLYWAGIERVLAILDGTEEKTGE